MVKKNLKNCMFALSLFIILLFFSSPVSAEITRISNRNSTFNGTSYFADKVGIGTSGPQGKLHIYSGASGATPPVSSDDLVVENGGDAGISILTNASASSVARISFGTNTDPLGVLFNWNNSVFGIRTNKAGALIDFNSGNDNFAMRIDGTGKVGIGTASPEVKLHIKGGSSLKTIGAKNSTSLYLEGGGNINDILQIGFGWNEAGTMNIPSSIGQITTNAGGVTSGSLFFATRSSVSDVAPTERMRITGNGDIGIGTNSPNEQLTVFDNSTTAKVALGIYTDTSGRGIRLATPDYNGVNTGSDLRISMGAGSGNTHSIFQGFIAGETSATGNIVFQQSGGNVGIGTASPVSLLTVSNGVYPTQNNSIVSIFNGNDSTFVTNSALLTIKNAGNRGTKGHASGSDLIRVEFSDAPAFIINKDGYVGIGTSSPSYTLTVLGAIYNTNGDVGTEILNGQPIGGSENASFIGTKTNHPLYLGVGDATKYIKIDTSGNVGIGTNNPLAKLEINSSNDNNRILRLTNAAGGDIYAYVSGTSLSSNFLIGTYSTANAFYIQNDGKIGIGTNTPSQKLDVNGSISISSADGCIKFKSGGEICDSP